MANTPTGHVYGSGELYFDQFEPGTRNLTGRRYMAYTPNLAITAETENLDGFDPDHGIPEKVVTIQLSTNRTGSFTTESIDAHSIALFLFGSASAFEQDDTPVTEELFTVRTGLTYQLGGDVGHGMGVRNVTSVSLTDDDATPVPYTLNEDYTLDAAAGTFTWTGEDNAAVLANYTPVTETRELILSGTDVVEGQLFFKSFNQSGPQRDVLIPYCKLSPNGEWALKGTEFQQIPFNLEILRLSPDTPAVIVQGRAD